MQNFAIDIGQANIAAAEAEGQSLVIEPEQVEDRRMQVMDLDLILHNFIAVLIGGAVDGAAFDAAAGQPATESIRIVVAAI